MHFRKLSHAWKLHHTNFRSFLIFFFLEQNMDKMEVALVHVFLVYNKRIITYIIRVVNKGKMLPFEKSLNESVFLTFRGLVKAHFRNVSLASSSMFRSFTNSFSGHFRELFTNMEQGRQPSFP